MTVAEIERELGRLRADATELRTSVMTHVAWVPPEWQEQARATLAGLDERYPSRTILLFPQEGHGDDGVDAELSLSRFSLPELERCVSTEVVELRLRGDRRRAPVSVVLPLVLPDLPVFLRWRGEPPFGDEPFEQLVDVVDRLIVDSREWPHAPGAYERLVPYFDRVAVSDIVWTRTLRWRRAIALLWPFDVGELHVVGPLPEAALLAGWLRSRLGRSVQLRHEDADRIELLELDGEPVEAREERWSPSDLLSHELDRFSRDRVYEESVRASAH